MAHLVARISLALILTTSPLTVAQMMGGPGAFAGGQGIRGTVTASSADSITLRGDDGSTLKIVVTPNTRIMQQREALKAADIKPGEYVVAMGRADDATREVHAAAVIVMTAEQGDEMKKRAAEAQASLGKTWIMGKITAMDETRLTIERTDKVSQVIEVDENTSMHRGGRIQIPGMDSGMGAAGAPGGGFGGRRGGGQNADGQQRQGPPPEGEAITLADMKVGDTVMGTGAVQGKTFVPKTLNVVPQGGGGRRGPRPGGGQAGDANQPPTQQ